MMLKLDSLTTNSLFRMFTDLENKISDADLEKEDIFADIDYICNSTSLIVDSLQRGLDIAQLPNGDIIVTEVKAVNTQYSWDSAKQRMIKIGQN